eukprot:1530776-Pyramimonas_sp.AAC.1
MRPRSLAPSAEFPVGPSVELPIGATNPCIGWGKRMWPRPQGTLLQLSTGPRSFPTWEGRM